MNSTISDFTSGELAATGAERQVFSVLSVFSALSVFRVFAALG